MSEPTPPALRYVGRFAPSPTGPLHAGSLVAALASWLDARAWPGTQPGQWLVRIEDTDTQRCTPALGHYILQQLTACQLIPDAPPLWQTQRTHLYESALAQLIERRLAYPCACSRLQIQQQSIQTTRPHGELIYPGTCRQGLGTRPARAWRMHTQAPAMVVWKDRRLGPQQQNVCAEVGDFVLKRADGPWAYQLAVVVDDADQGITHIVRGQDLASNTARQILLQHALALPTPTYLHTPLVLDTDGNKLSKQTGAQAFDMTSPLKALCNAAIALGLPDLREHHDLSIPQALTIWIQAWAHSYSTIPTIPNAPSTLKNE